MKLTLRSARKLEKKIAVRIQETAEYDVTFSAYDNSVPVDEKLCKAQNTIRVNIDSTLQLSRIRSTIRRDIQQLNERSGLNELISNRKLTIDEISIWQKIKDEGERSREPISSEIIAGKLEAIREGLVSSAYGGSRESVTVSTVSPELLKEAVTNIQQLQNSVEQLDDSILEVNMGSKITLSDTSITELQQLGIL